jgi:DNA modification methylase
MHDQPDRSVDLIVTSPPYWNLKDYGHEDQIGPQPYDQYLDRMNVVWDECYRVAKDDAVLAINVNSRRHQKRFYPIAFDIATHMKGWRLLDVMVWYIPNALPQPNHYRERLFDNKFEYVLFFTKDGSTDYHFSKPRVPQKYLGVDPRTYKQNAQGRCLGNIVRIPAYRPPNIRERGYHVAAFPDELAALLIHSFSREGDTVLDPFLGSGTTLKVCRGMNRIGVGYELNPEFESLIWDRISEPFVLPDWRDIDIIHSATMTPGSIKVRRPSQGGVLP